jgi:hypothetical protein
MPLVWPSEIPLLIIMQTPLSIPIQPNLRGGGCTHLLRPGNGGKSKPQLIKSEKWRLGSRALWIPLDELNPRCIFKDRYFIVRVLIEAGQA